VPRRRDGVHGEKEDGDERGSQEQRHGIRVLYRIEVGLGVGLVTVKDRSEIGVSRRSRPRPSAKQGPPGGCDPIPRRENDGIVLMVLMLGQGLAPRRKGAGGSILARGRTKMLRQARSGP
jgi:hypothetical protein